MKTRLTLWFLLWCSWGMAQSDSVFNKQEFLEMVFKHHPVAYQAELLKKTGDNVLMMAKGGFDPKLDGHLHQKYLDGKQYYSYLRGQLKVPTWFGIEAVAGYQANEGVRLNPESYTYEQGLWNAGLSVNLGKGLLLDQRRADLQQAKIIQESALLEQRLALNQLRLDAEKAYWEWSKAHWKNEVVKQSVEAAELRFKAIRDKALLGDKPMVDTLKAQIQLQEREIKFRVTQLELNNKKASLNTFLWLEGFVPLEMTETIIPEELPDRVEPIEQTIGVSEQLVMNHPEYLMSTNKIDRAKIDYRLQKEALKPELKLKYNALANNIPGDISYEQANYNWGATVSYPILNRKARGKTHLMEIKLKDAQYSMHNKQAQVKMKIVKAYNSWQMSYEQNLIQAQATNNYVQLLDSETILFNNGESSLFLLNQRDINALDAQLKALEYRYANVLGMLEYNWASQKWQ